MNKHFFFNNFHRIAIGGAAIFVILSVITIWTSWGIGWQLIGALVTLVTGFTYFVQKQRLDDMRLSYEAFTKFNERYDKLNDTLNLVVRKPGDSILCEHELNCLNDYFNLCAEEYYFYRLGIVYPIVWDTWINGMRRFHRDPRIGPIWDDELRSNGYYGFSRTVLQPD